MKQIVVRIEAFIARQCSGIDRGGGICSIPATGAFRGFAIRPDRQRELRINFVEPTQFGQRRQVVDAAQAEVVEEFARGAEQFRPARQLAVADDADPVALVQRADDVGIARPRRAPPRSQRA